MLGAMTATAEPHTPSAKDADGEKRVRVGVLSEQALLSHLLRNVLSNKGEIDVVFDSSDLGESSTLDALAATGPEVVLVRTCTDDNEALIRSIVQKVPGTKIILLSEDNDATVMVRAFDAGAAGCLALRLPLSSLVDIIARPNQSQPRSTTARNDSQPRVGLLLLTQRERAILRLIAEGQATRTIAADLHVTVATVRTHTQSILNKLGVHSKVEAAAYAVRHDLT